MQRFRAALGAAQPALEAHGRPPEDFSNGLATMWFHIDDRAAGDVLNDRLAPAIHRPVEELRERLAFGSAELVLDRLMAFRDAGVHRVFVWPVDDEISQLQRFSEEVLPALLAA